MYLFLLEQFWSIQFHWIEVIVLIIVIPTFAYTMKHVYFKIKFRKFLGEYNGTGTNLIYIHYKYWHFGKFAIYGSEGSGVTWQGKYENEIDDLSLEGIYNWINKNQEKSIPDKGRHQIYFSLDGTHVDITWTRLTGEERSGANKWTKSKGIYNQKNLLQLLFKS